GVAEPLESPRHRFKVVAERLGNSPEHDATILRQLAEQRRGIGAQLQRLPPSVVRATPPHDKPAIAELDHQAARGRDGDAEMAGQLTGRGARMTPEEVEHPQL